MESLQQSNIDQNDKTSQARHNSSKKPSKLWNSMKRNESSYNKEGRKKSNLTITSLKNLINDQNHHSDSEIDQIQLQQQKTTQNHQMSRSCLKSSQKEKKKKLKIAYSNDINLEVKRQNSAEHGRSMKSIKFSEKADIFVYRSDAKIGKKKKFSSKLPQGQSEECCKLI